MSLGRVDAFLDSYIEADLQARHWGGETCFRFQRVMSVGQLARESAAACCRRCAAGIVRTCPLPAQCAACLLQLTQ